MTSGGRFYREKFKPPTIQYIEEHFQNFYEFLQTISPEYVEYVKNMTTNYVTYITEMSSKVATYLEQTMPIVMNQERTLTVVAADADFIVSDTIFGVPVGLIDADFDNISKAFLLIIGRAVNTFAGQNNLDCTTAAHNQWQANVNGGAYTDLENVVSGVGKHDGQMLDTDWQCMLQGVIHPFTFMFDVTDRLVAPNNRIGLRLQNARARGANMVVTLDVYLKVVWKL